MRYTVVWGPAAEAELAHLWLDERTRRAVANAANEIDRRLQTDPEHEGESRPNNRRILFVAPLAVTFRIESDDRIARVIEVWRYHTRS